MFVSFLFDSYKPPFIDLENPTDLDKFDKIIEHLNTNKTQLHHILYKFNNYFYNMSNAYKTSHILLPMGDDFSF